MPSTAKYPFAAIPAPALLAAALLVLAPTSPACSADNPAAEGAGQVEQSATHPAAAKPAGKNPVLTLDDLVGIALEHNKGIEAARQRVAQSDGELTQARAAYLPRVEVAGTYSYVHRKDVTSLLTEDGGVVAPTATESEEVVNDDVAHASAQVSQLLYDFGRTGGAIAAERSNREAAEAALGKQRNATIFQVKKEYYNVLEKMRLVEVAADSVASIVETVNGAINPADQQRVLEQKLAQLPPEQLVQLETLKVQLQQFQLLLALLLSWLDVYRE